MLSVEENLYIPVKFFGVRTTQTQAITYGVFVSVEFWFIGSDLHIFGIQHRVGHLKKMLYLDDLQHFCSSGPLGTL